MPPFGTLGAGGDGLGTLGPLGAAEDLGFRLQGSGFRVEGSGFRVEGLGFKLFHGLGLRVLVVLCLGSRI